MPPRHAPHGSFTREFALRRQRRGEWHFDSGLARKILELAGPRTILDFGAGTGKYCAALRCRGVDGIPGIEELTNGTVLQGNLTDPELILPPHQLALCLEVAEHVPRSAEPVLLAHLTLFAELIVLSWAGPGQPGVGHVNCRPWSEVVELLAERGFRLLQAETDSFRETARISWFRKNLLVFASPTLPATFGGETVLHS